MSYVNNQGIRIRYADCFPTLEEFPGHRHLLKRAHTYFQPDPRVIGLVVGGSVAKGRVDLYSDIDLYIVVRDEDFDEVFAERDAAAEKIGKPLFRFIPDHLPFGRHWYIVLYQGAVQLDFKYTRVSEMTPSEVLADYVILKDSASFLADVQSKSQGLLRPQLDPKRLLALNQKFWIWCWYVFGKIKRGELWTALAGINDIRRLALLPMLHWVYRFPHEGYRRLEKKLDPKTAAQLEATVTGLVSEALYAALKAEISLFLDLRTLLSDRYEVTFDPMSEQSLQKEMSQRWHVAA